MARRFPAMTAMALWTGLIPAASASDPPVDPLCSLLDRSTFAAPTEGDVADARAALLRGLAAPPAGLAADDWEYLRHGDVARSVEADAPEMGEYLDNLIAKLGQDHAPFEHPGLVELRRVALHFRAVLENRRHEGEARAAFDRTRAAMIEALAHHAGTGSPAEFDRIADGVRWCVEHEQAAEFVRAARQRLSAPNLDIRLPSGLLRSATFTEAPPEAEAIDRNSEGIQTTGTMEVRGRYYLEPMPAVGGAILSLQFQGEVSFVALNTRKRISFRNEGLSRAAAVAQVAVDDRPFVTAQVLQVNASTGIRNERATVDQCLLRRPIGRLADRAIARKTPEVESDLSREVADGARAKLEARLGELTGHANALVQDTLLARARRLDLWPRFAVTTTEAGLRLALTEDARCGLAAPGPAPVADDGSGTVALHQGLATELINALYVGQKRPRVVDVNMFQRLNEAIQGDVSVGPFRDVGLRDRDDITVSLELDFPRPFGVAFRDGVFRLTLRTRELRLRDDPPRTGLDVTIDYRVAVPQAGIIEFTRQGEPGVSPRGAGAAAPAEVVVAVRNELLANLRPAFRVEPGKRLDTATLPLRLSGLAMNQGWLVGTIDPASDGPVAPSPPSP